MINKEKYWLYHQYVTLNKTLQEIADINRCSTKPILARLRKYKIPRRSLEEHLFIKFLEQIPYSALYKDYLVFGMSMREIAEKNKVAEQVINRLLKHHGIRKRKCHFPESYIIKLYRDGKSIGEISELSKTHKSVIGEIVNKNMLVVTKPFESVLTKEFLKENYIDKQRSITDIANDIGTSNITITRYLIEFGFDIRKRSIQNEIKVEEIKNPDKFKNRIKEGASAVDLSVEYDVGIMTVYRYAKKHNLEFTEISQAQAQIINFIKQHYGGIIIKNCRKTIKPLELDIFLPELNLAFEFNGLYWHSELYKHKNYHRNKLESCQSKNIKLIQIWEDDWYFRREIVKSIITGSLGIHKKIYARKCEIKIISFHGAKQFIRENHLQGEVPFTLGYGLYYKDELVQIMTFIKKNSVYEISRLCTKLNYNVIGGSSKLFSYFTKNNKFEQIFTYCDRDYFTGKVYENLGMILISKTEPNYRYYNRGYESLSRQQCQKHKLIKLGFDPSKSEREIMKERGFLRVYNSGNLKFVISKNEEAI